MSNSAIKLREGRRNIDIEKTRDLGNVLSTRLVCRDQVRYHGAATTGIVRRCREINITTGAGSLNCLQDRRLERCRFGDWVISRPGIVRRPLGN